MGTLIRPRLSIKFSNKFMYVQCTNDISGVTMLSLTTNVSFFKNFKFNNCLTLSKFFGILVGRELSRRSIYKVKFDKSGRKYHGNVKVFLESVRLYVNV
jgi:large subunit ribosomal protein L18